MKFDKEEAMKTILDPTIEISEKDAEKYLAKFEESKLDDDVISDSLDIIKNMGEYGEGSIPRYVEGTAPKTRTDLVSFLKGEGYKLVEEELPEGGMRFTVRKDEE